MFNKLKAMCRLTAEARKESVSMRRRLDIYWISMGTAVLAALLLLLGITGVFSGSAGKLNDTLTLQQQNRVRQVTDHMEGLESQCIALSKQISGKLSDVLAGEGAVFQELDDNPELIVKVEEELYGLLNTTLQSSKCSGAFVMLDATCNTALPEADTSRMGIYTRYSDLSGVNTSNKHQVYFRGASEIARREKIQMHNRWNLEFDMSLFPEFESRMQTPVQRLADSCYWTEKVNLKDTWEDVVLLCVPVLDSNKMILGICGVELSELYFQLSYPAAAGPYGDMMLAVLPKTEKLFALNKVMMGTTEETVLNPSESMTIKEGRYFNTYINGEQKFLGLQDPLKTKLAGGEELMALTLVSEKNYRSQAEKEKVVWMFLMLTIILLMLFISKMSTKQIVRPIARILTSVKNEVPLEGQKSGIAEIDELAAYICDRMQNKNEHELPPNIEELFTTFRERVMTLTPMERTVLQYYIDGCSIEDVADKSFISINTVKKHNTNINRKLGVTGREELMLYIDIFRRCGRLNEIAYHN